MRRISGMMLIVLLALVVAACGADDEDDEPTAEPTEEVVATEAADETATTEATEEEATEDATTEIVEDTGVVGTPVEVGTPDMVSTPASVATPETASTPLVVATPIADATPANGDAAVVADMATPDAATPTTASVGSVELSGQVVLPGTLNETFVIAEDGCVGLNGYSDMRTGRQLVVRDQDGTIVGVTNLQASDASDTCAWDFSLDVPESSFYSVSIPMEVEYIFTSEEVQQNGGEVTVPLG